MTDRESNVDHGRMRDVLVAAAKLVAHLSHEERTRVIACLVSLYGLEDEIQRRLKAADAMLVEVRVP